MLNVPPEPSQWSSRRADSDDPQARSEAERGSEFDNRSGDAQAGLAYGDIVKELYLGLLERPTDAEGFKTYLAALSQGNALSEVIRQIVASREFQSRHHPDLLPRPVLPDLTELFPGKYIRRGPDNAVFEASCDDDFTLLESLIRKYRYYDSFGVWAPDIDLDKQVTAAIIEGLGARSCLELGCFTGPVLSVLAEKGVDVCGVEISHLAFLLAHANVHEKIRFGDLLDLPFDTQYDVFLAMDILEHLNPLRLDYYISRISRLVRPKGFVYINSPMFGADDLFGTTFEVYLPEWQQAGPDDFWRHLHCDAKGWPMHGHLIWASPLWWERAFLKYRLIRNRDLERILHGLLAPFFEKVAPARRSLFVLTHSDFSPDAETLGKCLSRALSPVIASIPG